MILISNGKAIIDGKGGVTERIGCEEGKVGGDTEGFGPETPGIPDFGFIST